MNIRYWGKVDGHYIVQSDHRVFVDKKEITEMYEQRPSDIILFEDIKFEILDGNLP